MAKRGRVDGETGAAGDEQARLDLWLWAARFYKTRGLASEAIGGGKVSLNGERPKRSRAVRIGDRIRVQLGPYEHVLTVQMITNRRGPAREAAALYEEDPAGVVRRAELAARLKAEAALFAGREGRPTKKERREIGKMRGKR